MLSPRAVCTVGQVALFITLRKYDSCHVYVKSTPKDHMGRSFSTSRFLEGRNPSLFTSFLQTVPSTVPSGFNLLLWEWKHIFKWIFHKVMIAKGLPFFTLGIFSSLELWWIVKSHVLYSLQSFIYLTKFAEIPTVCARRRDCLAHRGYSMEQNEDPALMSFHSNKEQTINKLAK